MIFASLLIGLLAIILSVFLWLYLDRDRVRSNRTAEISRLINQGSKIFLLRQMTTAWIIVAAVGLFLILWSDYLEAVWFFLIGAMVGGLAAIFGVLVSAKAGPRAAELAQTGFRESFRVAFSGGQAVSLFSIGLGLTGLVLVYHLSPEPFVLLYYVFGASLMAFLIRISGGIYTKSADIGADLVGKKEQGLPEDDFRNPAAIADQVGDRVGDLAGTAADLLETYLSSVVAAMILGWLTLGRAGFLFPLGLASLSLLAALIGGYTVRLIGPSDRNLVREAKRVRAGLRQGRLITFLLFLIGAAVLSVRYLNDWRYFLVVFIGALVGWLISAWSIFYTLPNGRVVGRVARSARHGPAAVVAEGMSAGLFGILGPAAMVSMALVSAYSLGGFYGIALTAIGLIGILTIELSANCFGPIADNAGGIVRAAGLGEEARSRTDGLDSIGNSLAAVGKGFAITAAAFTVLAWLAIYLKIVLAENLSFLDAWVLTGMFLGASLVFFFSALIVGSVNSGAKKMSDQIRGQMEEQSNNYRGLILGAANRSLRGLIGPVFIALVGPVLIGWYLGPGAIGGILAGSLTAAFPLALFMAYSGAIWDNAKKQTEPDGSAGSAVLVGDLVGDPLKDAAAPALNILIKLMGVVTLIFVFLFV